MDELVVIKPSDNKIVFRLVRITFFTIIALVMFSLGLSNLTSGRFKIFSFETLVYFSILLLFFYALIKRSLPLLASVTLSFDGVGYRQGSRITYIKYTDITRVALVFSRSDGDFYIFSNTSKIVIDAKLFDTRRIEDILFDRSEVLQRGGSRQHILYDVFPKEWSIFPKGEWSIFPKRKP